MSSPLPPSKGEPANAKCLKQDNVGKIGVILPPLKGVRGMSAISINYPITKGKV